MQGFNLYPNAKTYGTTQEIRTLDAYLTILSNY